MNRLYFLLFFTFLAFFACTISYAQLDVVNTGTLITVERGATLFINGSYYDRSNTRDFGNDPNTPTEILDAPIFLSGTLHVTGNIDNGSGIGTELIYAFENATHTGEVVLGGTSTQTITGVSPSYFPNLTITNPSGVILGNAISIDNDLTLTRGGIDLNAHNIRLGIHGQIAGESSVNPISGTSGQVLTSQFDISTGASSTNYRGVGLGYDATGTNLSNVFFERIHRNASAYTVANGVHVLREYKIKTSTATATLSQVFFAYHDAELNGLAEASLALYFSNNGGTSWIKASSTVNTTTNVVRAGNVPVVDTSGGNENIFVLAASACATGNTPDATITSTNDEGILAGSMDICDGNDLAVEVASNDAGYYRWATPVGAVTTRAFAHGDMSLADDGSYTVNVRNQRGCENTSTLSVNVRDIPVADFDITPDPRTNSICWGTELTFTDASTVTEGSITTREWDYGDTNTGPDSGTANHTYSTYGLFDPQLTVESAYGCRSNTAVWSTDVATEPLRVESLPAPSFEMRDDIFPAGDTITELCEDLAVHFRNQSTYSDFEEVDRTAELSYHWDFGHAAATSASFEDSYVYTDHGSFTIRLTATATTGCAVTTAQSIIIDPEPVPGFTPRIDGSAVTEVCTGEYLLFDNISSIPDGTAITYSWTFNDGASSTEVSPSKQFTTPGTYTVWLEAYSVEHGCSESTSFDILVNPPPTDDFDVSHQDICIGEEVTFTNNSTIATGTLSYEWNFGDGATSTSASGTVNHTYTDAGMYEIILSRTSDKGCSNAVARTITVHPEPTPNFVFDNVCDGEEVLLSNASSISSDIISGYHWDFGDGHSTTEISPYHTYATSGDYEVTLTATSNFGCTDEITQTVSIYRNPSFTLGGSIIACATDYTLDPSTDGGAYLPAGTTFEWTNSEGTFIASSTSITIDQPDTYVATIVSPAPKRCETVVNVPVFLFQPADLGEDLNVCEQVTLDAEAGIPASQKALATNTSYQWWKDGAPVSTDQTIVVTETAAYTVQITREVGVQSCASTDDIHISVMATPPVVNLPTQYTACGGESVMMTSDITGDSYSWIDLSTGAEVSDSIRYTTADAGNYRLTVTNGVCTTQDETTVLIHAIPSVSFSSSATSVCLGEAVTFEDLSFVSDGVISATHWDFGDETNVTNQPAPSKTFASNGDFAVTLTATSSNGCSDTFTQVVAVKEMPVVDFILTGACAGEAIGMVNNSTVGANFTWDFGDGTSATSALPGKSYLVPGTYDVMLTADLNDCEVSAIRTVTIDAVPELDLGGTITTCGTDVVLDAGNPGATYRWYDPVSGVDLATSQRYTVAASGRVGVEITNAQGCVVSDEAEVTLNTPVVPDLGVDRTICDAELLDAGFFSEGSYTWSTGETTRTIEAVNSGTYTVSVVDQHGCTGSAGVTITVNSTPAIALGEDIVACEGYPLVLDPGYHPDYTYLWSTGEVTPTIEVTTSGTYRVQASAAGCTTSDDIHVVVHTIPVADFHANDICTGEVVVFDNVSTYPGAGTLSYVWTFGDGTSSTLENPTKPYHVPGTYTVTLSAYSPEGCVDQMSRVVTVREVPRANFSAPSGCQEDVLVFNNTTSYSGVETPTYLWEFGDGQTATEEAPEHRYASSGNYFVRLTVNTAMGCSNTFTREVYVGAKPELSRWENNIASCNGAVTLDAQNPGSTYLWFNNTTGQTLEVTESGVYTVDITSADGCALTGEVAVEIFDPVRLNLPDFTETCGETLLDPGFEEAHATYLWSTGQSSRMLAVETSDTFWVEVVSRDLCIGRDTAEVVIRPVPVVEIGEDTELCVGEEMLLEATSSLPITYLWSTGESTAAIIATNTGRYSVWLTTDHGCTYEEEIHLVFHDLPAAPLPDEVTGCDEVTLDAQTTSDEYLWSTGETSPGIVVTASGQYAVTITNPYGCITTDTTEVAVVDSPVLELGDDITLCHGETTQLDAGTAAGNYWWSDNTTERWLTVGTTNTYSVTITDDYGCSSYDEVAVVVRDPLALDLGEDQLLCSNAGVYLNAGVSNVRYAWGSETGFTATEKEIRPEETGRYWVTIEDSFGCVASDTILITPTSQTIMASFLIPSVVGVGDRVHFVQLSEPDPISFDWAFGDGGFSGEENPTYRYFAEGEYAPTLVVSNGVCTDTLTKAITVRNARFEGAFDQDFPEFVDILEADIYPNPAQDVVQVALKLTVETKVLVRIYTLYGYMVEEREVYLEEESIAFDFAGRDEGIYLVKVIAGDKTSTLKLLKAGRTR